MEVMAHAVEPVGAVVQDSLRRMESFPGQEFPAEGVRMDPDLGADIPELVAFCLGEKVPAVDQMESVDFSFLLRGIGRDQNEEG